MPTSEFDHYPGCNRKDPDNCSACALVTGGPEGPNYAAWPLSYLENRLAIPAKWFDALVAELDSENELYAANLRVQIKKYGLRIMPDSVAR